MVNVLIVLTNAEKSVISKLSNEELQAVCQTGIKATDYHNMPPSETDSLQGYVVALVSSKCTRRPCNFSSKTNPPGEGYPRDLICRYCILHLCPNPAFSPKISHSPRNLILHQGVKPLTNCLKGPTRQWSL